MFDDYAVGALNSNKNPTIYKIGRNNPDPVWFSALPFDNSSIVPPILSLVLAVDTGNLAGYGSLFSSIVGSYCFAPNTSLRERNKCLLLFVHHKRGHEI